MSAVIAQHGTVATIPVALGITKKNLVPSNVPLTLGSRSAHLGLMVAYVLELDPEQVYLSVSKSQYGLYLIEDPEPRLLVHWDYEREPNHQYPAAHIQVNGDSSGFERAIDLARSRLGNDCPDRPLGSSFSRGRPEVQALARGRHRILNSRKPGGIPGELEGHGR